MSKSDNNWLLWLKSVEVKFNCVSIAMADSLHEEDGFFQLHLIRFVILTEKQRLLVAIGENFQGKSWQLNLHTSGG